MLNHIVIMGRLTRDPELRRTGSGTAVASFTLAVDRDYSGKDSKEKETDFVDCVAWRQTGEFVSKYFSKGRMAVVEGRLQIRKWKNKDGENRYSTEVLADHVYFGDSKKEASGDNSASNSSGYGGGYGGYPVPNENAYGGGGYPAPGSDFAMLDDDDAQLPF